MGHASIIRATTSLFTLTEAICHGKVLLVVSVKWRRQAQGAGSFASRLIRAWWWGAQASLLNRSGRDFAFLFPCRTFLPTPCSSRLEQGDVFTSLYLLPMANAPFVPPVALQRGFPLLLHPSPPCSSSCPSAARGRKQQQV